MSKRKIKKTEPVKAEPAYMNTDQDKTLHCGNCHHSTATQNPIKPLVCGSELAKKIFKDEAGTDRCAPLCPDYLVFDDEDLTMVASVKKL